jgi:hypothetical protein
METYGATVLSEGFVTLTPRGFWSAFSNALLGPISGFR